MSARAADTVARVRVCRAAGLPIAPELQDEIIECLERVAIAGSLRRKRDALIRRAALMLPPASAYEHAGALATEAERLMRVWPIVKQQPAETEPASPRACLHAAGLLADLPGSRRQFYRVLKAGNH